MNDEPIPVAEAESAAPVDVTVLERIEGELRAVERALEQIDQGIYEGFVGLDAPDAVGVAEERATSPDLG